jgi:hypothetical protein
MGPDEDAGDVLLTIVWHRLRLWSDHRYPCFRVRDEGPHALAGWSETGASRLPAVELCVYCDGWPHPIYLH